MKYIIYGKQSRIMTLRILMEHFGVETLEGIARSGCLIAPSYSSGSWDMISTRSMKYKSN